MSKQINRRDFLKIAGVTSAAGILTACAPSLESTLVPTSVPTAGEPAATAALQKTIADLVGSDLLPGAPEVQGGWTTILPNLPEGLPLSPAVTVSGNRIIDATVVFPEGQNIDNNPYTEFCEKAFGIKWKSAWTCAAADECAQKFNLAMASNDLPDFMEGVSLNDFKLLREAGLVEDLTDAWDKYAHPKYMKEALDFENGVLWQYAKVNGRIMGLPVTQLLANSENLLWLRQDWLDAVKMDVPTTIEELGAVAKAFVDAGLGEGTTLGLATSNGIVTWAGSLDPIFGSFGAMPGFWLKDGDRLTYGTTRSEMKNALTLLADWYKQGIISPDFLTTAPGDIGKPIAASQTGMHFTPWWAPYWHDTNKQNDPDANWIVAQIPEGPTGLGKAHYIPVQQGVFVFRKGFAQVDAVMKMFSWFSEAIMNPENKWFGWRNLSFNIENGEVKFVVSPQISWGEKVYYGPVGGTTGVQFLDPMHVYNNYKYIDEVLSKVPKDQWDIPTRLILDDPTGLSGALREGYVFSIDARTKDKAFFNEFTGEPTPTQVEQGVNLQTLESEMIFGIISGQKSIDDFDQFVKDWNSIGGEAVTNEVNDWYQSQK